MRAWLLTSNPSAWDIWSWWNETNEELDGWTIVRHLNDIEPGDHFALWISGKRPGVYAVGRIEGLDPRPIHPRGGHWKNAPRAARYAVTLDTAAYLFDKPILKSDLTADPDFKDAVVLRMPGAANPIALTDAEWSAIERRVPAGHSQRERTNQVQPKRGTAITAVRAWLGRRRPGQMPAGVLVSRVSAPPSKASNRKREEADLVWQFAKYVGQDKVQVRSKTLPTGRRLICDAFVPSENLLVEAKAAADSGDVRRAIGQLLDYQRVLAPGAHLAVLLPEPPDDHLVGLLADQRITFIVPNGAGDFRYQ